MQGEEVGLDVDGMGVGSEAWEVEVTELGGWMHEQVDGEELGGFDSVNIAEVCTYMSLGYWSNDYYN